MKRNFTYSSDDENQRRGNTLSFSRDELGIICNELSHLLNEVLEQELGVGRGETFGETIALWRAHAPGFCRRLVRRGWRLEDAAFVISDKNRLADMLERALTQETLKESPTEILRVEMTERYVETQRSEPRSSISLL